jgi:hypothetical protein
MPTTPTYPDLITRLVQEQAKLTATTRQHLCNALMLLLAAHPSDLTHEEIHRAHRHACRALEAHSLADAVEAAIQRIETMRSMGVVSESPAWVQ